MFCKDGLTRLQMLRLFIFESMSNADGRFPQKHLPSFITQVHALRSAAGAIGADEISAEAEALENAGKSADTVFIMEKLPDFIEHLDELTKNIHTVIDVKQRQSGKAETSACLPVFGLLSEALKTKNGADIDRYLEELGKTPLDSKLKEAYNEISDQILMAEYESAIQTIEKLTGSS